jgi:ATP-dependent Clp protease adapter protein ClpS
VSSPGPGQPEQKVEIGKPQTRLVEETEDAPRYKVMLLFDDGYLEEPVTNRLTEVVDDLDKPSAQDVYRACEKQGSGMVGVYPLEIAEFYVEQLLRSEPMIFTELVKEGEAE